MVLGSSLVILTALLLSAAGIYAMMSFTVSRRRREIGILRALGATRGQLFRYCLLVDDAHRNVEGARRVGIAAFRWTGPGDLPYLKAALGL